MGTKLVSAREFVDALRETGLLSSDKANNGASEMTSADRKKTRRVTIELSEDQFNALMSLTGKGVFKTRHQEGDHYEFDTRSNYLRAIIAKDYAERTGDDFPPDPILGYQES